MLASGGGRSPQRRRPGLRARARRAPLALLALLVVGLLGLAAPAQARPAIPPGREAEIVALVAPYRFDEPIRGSWSLRSINTEVSTIHIWLAGPGDVAAHVTLDHPDYAPAVAERLGAFSLTIVDAPSGSDEAITALRAAIVAADDGTFWRESKAPGGGSSPVTLDVDDDRDRGRFASAGWSALLDGLVILGALALALAALLARALLDLTDRRVRVRLVMALAAITAVAAGLRLALSPVVGLTAWPFLRMPFIAERIYEGPVWAILAPGPLWLSDAITGSTFALALAAPLAIFLHARHLLASSRAALIAAGLLALLPLHIRFSHSDVVFIASITISSLTFALLHSAARESDRRAALLAFILLGPPLALTFLMRPLNILYAPLLLGALAVHEGIGSRPKPAISRRRQLGIGALILGVTALVGVPALLGDYPDQVREGLSLDTVVHALRVLVSPRDNALLNLRMTPPALPLLAIFGAWQLWRRGRRRLLAFLGLWLLAFLAAHAYVVPREPMMQARYHLHLVIPFVYLASVGLLAAARASVGERWPWRAALGLGLLSLLGAPLIHSGFIRDVDLNQVDEWRWVHEQRLTIPAGCTIVEYIPEQVGGRFARVGSYTEAGAAYNRWTNVGYTGADELGEPPLADLLSSPPECLYVYEGLPCAAFKPIGSAMAAACADLRGRLDLEEVARHHRSSRAYDENLSRGLVAGEELVFRLFRHRSGPRSSPSADGELSR